MSNGIHGSGCRLVEAGVYTGREQLGLSTRHVLTLACSSARHRSQISKWILGCRNKDSGTAQLGWINSRLRQWVNQYLVYMRTSAIDYDGHPVTCHASPTLLAVGGDNIVHTTGSSVGRLSTTLFIRTRSLTPLEASVHLSSLSKNRSHTTPREPSDVGTKGCRRPQDIPGKPRRD